VNLQDSDTCLGDETGRRDSSNTKMGATHAAVKRVKAEIDQCRGGGPAHTVEGAVMLSESDARHPVATNHF
jgi:hypothetical protein